MTQSKKRIMYTDLEKEYMEQQAVKHDQLRLEAIDLLVQRYSNDSDLGRKVREFIQLKNKTSNE